MRRWIFLFKSVVLLLIVTIFLSVMPSNNVLALKDRTANFSSDYRKWNQGQSAYQEMRWYGCFITAQAKMLYEAGVNRSQMNPDFWYNWQRSHSGIVNPPSDSQNDNYDVSLTGTGCANPASYAKSLGVSDATYWGGWKYDNDQIWFNINTGYYTICQLEWGAHYVLVDNYTSKQKGNIYIYDSYSDYGKEFNDSPHVLTRTVTAIYVYKLGNAQQPTPSVSWSQYSAQEIKEGKVMLAKTATLSNAVMDNVADCGIDIYDSSDKYLGGKSEVPDRSGYTYVNMWYDLSSELGFSITPGTVYRYSFWVRINGKKYESTRETVTCPPVYTVKFDSQGGSAVSQLTVGKNQTISNLPTSTLNGYKLDGWYTSTTGGTKLTTSTKITGNITYYARWVSAEDPNTRIAINSTNFPDSVFREYVSETFDTDKSGFLSEEEVSAITQIHVQDKPISSLKGIEFFTALTELNAQNNNISYIDVSNNRNLLRLTVARNNLTSIDLSNNTKLTYLMLSVNQLTSLDLSNNPNISILYIPNNNISTLLLNSEINLRDFFGQGNSFKVLDIRNMPYLLEAYESSGKVEYDTWVDYKKSGHNLAIDKDVVVITGNESFSVELVAVSNGSASLSKTSAKYGDEVIVTTTPETGYTLDSILVNGIVISGNKFTMPATNTTVEVTFKKITYSVLLSSINNGTASLSKSSANYCDEITVTTTPNTGYTLDSILVNGTAITCNSFTMPAENTTVVVTFKKAVYIVSVSEVSNGTVIVSKTEANFGDEITITATPNAGYELDYIKVNGTTIIGDSFLMPSKDVTVEVAFKSTLSIISQPSNYEGAAGSTAKFTVVAEGSGLQYQWQLKKGSSWANLTSGGATTSTMSIKVDDSKNGKVYRCVITDAGGAEIVTDSVSITVKQPSNAITIKSQPSNYVGPVCSSAKFTVVAEGSGLKYQWQLKKGSSWANLSTGGATTSTMTIKVDESRNGKVYRCIITDANGEELATESVSITVKSPSIIINSQPSNYVGLAGSTAKFTVSAEGSGLKYQWQLKKGNSWSNLSTGGATTSTMTIKVDDSKNGKVYRCLITSADGEELATESVSITVKQPTNAIVIDTQPTDYSGEVGTTAKFSVAAQGNGLTYQWQLKKGKSWSNLTSGGATTSTMSIKVDSSKDGKTYRCVITDSEGNEIATEEVTIHVVTPVASTVPSVAAVASNDDPVVTEPEIETPVSDEIA